MPFRTAALSKLIKNTTNNSYLTLEILNYTITEELDQEEEDPKTHVSAEFRIHCMNSPLDEQVFSFTETGQGFVDAVFHGLMKRIRSLDIIEFPESFEPKISMSMENAGPNKLASGATCTLVVEPKKDKKLESFTFTSEEFSINAAALCSTIQAVEFFLNAHQAYSLVQAALRDAKKRYRHDLVDSYTKKLISLVQIADYSTVCKKKQ